MILRRMLEGATFVLAIGGLGLILAGYWLVGLGAWIAGTLTGMAADRLRTARAEP